MCFFTKIKWNRHCSIFCSSCCCLSWCSVSMKFGSKLMYLDYLHELAQHLQLDQLIIPLAVRKLVNSNFVVILCHYYLSFVFVYFHAHSTLLCFAFVLCFVTFVLRCCNFGEIKFSSFISIIIVISSLYLWTCGTISF